MYKTADRTKVLEEITRRERKFERCNVSQNRRAEVLPLLQSSPPSNGPEQQLRRLPSPYPSLPTTPTTTTPTLLTKYVKMSTFLL